MISKRNQKFIAAHGGGRVFSFANLPRPHQLALIHYMAIDGEAWVIGDDETPAQALPAMVKAHRRERFGMINLPTKALLAATMEDEGIKGVYSDFEAYHRWYVYGPDSSARQEHLHHTSVPDHPRRHRWPCILSCMEDETFQDGWHRFHCYVRQNARIIPCLWYAA